MGHIISGVGKKGESSQTLQPWIDWSLGPRVYKLVAAVFQSAAQQLCNSTIMHKIMSLCIMLRYAWCYSCGSYLFNICMKLWLYLLFLVQGNTVSLTGTMSRTIIFLVSLAFDYYTSCSRQSISQ